MVSNYVNNLSTKFGVPEQVAKQVGPYAISFLMNRFSGKVKEEGRDKAGIMGVTGGGLKDNLTKGIGNKPGGMFK